MRGNREKSTTDAERMQSDATVAAPDTHDRMIVRKRRRREREREYQDRRLLLLLVMLLLLLLVML